MRVVDAEEVEMHRGITFNENGIMPGEYYRPAPMHPEKFAAELALKMFTNWADLEVVAGLYADTVLSVVGNTKRLEFEACRWTNREACDLAEVLPLARQLERLKLSSNLIGTDGLNALAATISGGGVKSLKWIDFRRNLGDSTALAKACKEAGIKFKPPVPADEQNYRTVRKSAESLVELGSLLTLSQDSQARRRTRHMNAPQQDHM